MTKLANMVNKNNKISWYTHKQQMNDITSLSDYIFRMAILYNRLDVNVPYNIYDGTYKGKAYPFVEHSIDEALQRFIKLKTKLVCPIKKVYKITGSLTPVHAKNFSIILKVSLRPHIKTVMPQLGCIVCTQLSKDMNSTRVALSHDEILLSMFRQINGLLVGMKFLNLCYMYDNIACNKAISEKITGESTLSKSLQKQIVMWRGNKLITKKLHYFFVNLPKSTLQKWIKPGMMLDYWKVILFQTFFALCVLEKQMPGFVHYNITPKSIYIKRVKAGGQFVYKVGDKKYFIPNYGFIVKIMPCVFSHSSGFKNAFCYNKDYQDAYGFSPSMTSYYDIHLLCNTIYAMKSLNPKVGKFIRELFPKEYLHIGDNEYIRNNRLRNKTKRHKVLTHRSVMTSSFFNKFKVLNKKEIVFYPEFRV